MYEEHAIIIPRPYQREILEDLARQANAKNWQQAMPTARWLLKHDTSEKAVAAVREAWGRSRTPLREWAEGITAVEAWTSEWGSQLGILVFLRGCPFYWALQEAPLNAADIENLPRVSDSDLSALLLDILQAAPNLILSTEGGLLGTDQASEPLSHIRRWTDSLKDSPLEYPDWNAFRAEFVLEIAGDGHGNVYVLRKDGALFFFDHGERVLLPCRRTALELLATYFQRPDCVCDYPWIDIQDPEITEREPARENPLDEIRAAYEQLTSLARLAVGIRALQRVAPSCHPSKLSPSWRVFAEDIDAMLDACRQVAMTGQALDEATLASFLSTLRKAEYYWHKYKPRSSCAFGHYGGQTFLWRLRGLLGECQHVSPSNPVRIIAELMADSGVYVEDIDPENLLRATRIDIEHLLQHRLGEPETFGAPVPPAFFDRPLE